MVTIPQFRSTLDGLVKIVKYDRLKIDSSINETTLKIGPTTCNLERIAYHKSSSPVPICPWHWVFIERNDRFPFKRAHARCNCPTCLAKTVYN
jgi:hypothetical protein